MPIKLPKPIEGACGGECSACNALNAASLEDSPISLNFSLGAK